MAETLTAPVPAANVRIGRVRLRTPAVVTQPSTQRQRARAGFLRDMQSSFLFAWNPAMREPHDEYRQAWIEVTSRTIDALHNSGWLAGGVDQATAAMCGPMMALNPKPDASVFGRDEKAAAAWARHVKPRFEVWARSPYACDFTGQQDLGQMCAQQVKWWFATGEIWGLIKYRKRPGNSHGTKIQAIPAQRIPQAARFQPSVQGVIFDDDGVPVRYCINSFHPNRPNDVAEHIVRARDRYGRAVVIHVKDSAPTVTRGLTPLAPALQIVRQYDQLANATLTAALIQAIFAATVESEAPTDQLLTALRDDEEQATPQGGAEGAAVGADDFSRFMSARAQWYDHTKFDLGKMGKVLHIFPGEKLNFLRSEHPNDNYKAFSRTLLLEIARCLGITFEQLTGDREGATYSSERMGSAENWQINMYRRHHIPGRFMQHAYEAWLEEDILLGNTAIPGGIEAFYAQRDAICRADWRGPPKPTADDLKTSKANQIKKREGIITEEQWCAEEGQDWQDVHEQRKREQDSAESLGLKSATTTPFGAGDPGDDGDGEPRSMARRLSAIETKLDLVLDNQAMPEAA